MACGALHNLRSPCIWRVLVSMRTMVPSPLLSMKTTSPRCRTMFFRSRSSQFRWACNDSVSVPATMRPLHSMMVTLPTSRVCSASAILAPWGRPLTAPSISELKLEWLIFSPQPGLELPVRWLLCPCLSGGDTPRDRGMRMQEPLHPAGRRALGEVLFGEFVHGRYEWTNAGDVAKSVAVGLTFVVARIGVQRGQQHERQHGRN